MAFSSPAIGTFGPPVEPVTPPASAAAPQDAPPHTQGSPLQSPPPARARRKVSCTVTLTVAAALAAVTVGGGFLFDLWPGTGSDKTNDSAGHSPSATEKVKKVPKAFIGTWEGPFKVSFAGSELEAGTFSVAIRAGRTGAKFATVSQFDALGSLSCEDNLVLRGVTPKELVADGRSSGKPGTKCTPGTHTVKLRLDGARLQYTSKEPRAGDPRATLERRQ